MRYFSVALVMLLVVACGKERETTVTKFEPDPLNLKRSKSCGDFTFSSHTFTGVNNLQVRITSKGHPLFISLVPDGNKTRSTINNPAGQNLEIRILRDGEEIVRWQTGVAAAGENANTGFPGNLSAIDSVEAGDHLYQVEAVIPPAPNANPNDKTAPKEGLIGNLSLVVFEL